ncbi:hypothetical protein [Paenibacillus sp. Y412MC10]|uniref:hypothetical protein n=1 Tax=Geobacillus sp. (strain Y412MC10) TaxID=481743 RepID=UPI0016430FD6|nr:hypothetical protein [Paenibacillus sp. Y412MC10]
MNPLILTIYQPQSELMEKLYGDPHGLFESLANRKMYHPEQFDEKGMLDMRAWAPVFDLDISNDPFFAFVRNAYRSCNNPQAFMSLYALFNQQLLVMTRRYGYLGRTMSVGDVIAFKTDVPRFYYCDNYDWKVIAPVNIHDAAKLKMSIVNV